MRKHLANYAAALAALFSLVAGSRLQAVDIFVLTGTGGGGSNQSVGFGKIDSTTGAYTQISANVGSGNQVSNLAWNAAAGNFFVTENTTPNVTLRTLTTSGTLSSSIGTIGNLQYGMAYNGTNMLYGYNYSNDNLGSINPSTGVWTAIGSTGQSSSSPIGGRLTYLNGSIYGSIYSNDYSFGTFSTVNGAFSEISQNNAFADMVLATDGTTMYGVFGTVTAGQQKLYSIDPLTGSIAQIAAISGTGLGTRFYGASMIPVPEPSSYALAAIASGVMAFVARRRKARLA